jgi:hypothetical protein
MNRATSARTSAGTGNDSAPYDSTSPEGTPAIIYLYRSINAGSYAQVATLTCYGSLHAHGRHNDGEGLSGFSNLTDTNSGSITFTDPDHSTQNRQYKAVLQSRGPSITDGEQQRVSIVTTE